MVIIEPLESLNYWMKKWGLKTLLVEHVWKNHPVNSCVRIFKCETCSARLQFKPGVGRSVRTALASDRYIKDDTTFKTCKNQLMIKALW